MANTLYFAQMSDVRTWRVLSEETLRNDLVNLYSYRLPHVRSRNMKLRIIEALLTCKNGTCLLSYNELREMVVDGKAMPSSTAG